MLCAASFASAQEKSLENNAFSIKVGAFIPTDSATGNDSAWFAFGVDYRLHHQLTVDKQHMFVSVSLDFAAHDNVRTVPLLANVTRYFDTNFYLTAGVGASFTRLPGDDKTRFAFQIGAGYDFANWEYPVFVEARFLGTDDSKLNGFGLFAGIRF